MRYDLTVAIIGTGFMGKQYAAILSNLVDKIILCSTDEEAGKSLSEQYQCPFYTDYHELLRKEKVDFAAICLPTHLHCEASLAAIGHGINVLCEKPFASSEEESRKMIKAADENGVLLMVAHCLRFSRSYEYLRRCINDARFGKLIYLNTYREGPKPYWSIGNWLANTALSGGVVKDLHIHDTDMIVGWLGMPKSVYTTGSTSACRTIYNFDNDISVSSSASWRDVKDIPTETGFDAVFEKACVKHQNNKLTVYIDNTNFDPIENEEFSEFFGEDFYANEIKYFCHCLVNKNLPLLCPPEDSLKTISVSCAESESLKSRAEKTIS